MSEAPLDRLDRFLRQSHNLLQLAQAGDWPAFEVLLHERERELPALKDNSFLIAVARAGIADEVKARIADIQQLNDQITAVAEQGKAELSGQLRQILRSDKAISAYKK